MKLRKELRQMIEYNAETRRCWKICGDDLGGKPDPSLRLAEELEAAAKHLRDLVAADCNED